MDPILIAVKILPWISTIFLFMGILALATPKEKTSDIDAGDMIQRTVQGKGSLGSLNPSGGPLERLDYWLTRNLGLETSLDQLHMLLGRPEDLTPVQILHQKEGAVGIAAFFLFFLIGPLGIVLSPIAFFIPDALLRGKVERRQQEILGNFPQFVDLSALMIESGADYMTAFDRIVKVSRKKSDLELEIDRTIAEVSLGASRRDALRHLADRVGVQEIRSFVGLIIQSEELGTSLVGLLREYATDMRFRRLNKAEKLAAQAATKMLIPLFVFIFPTVFILMLAPMMKNLFEGGLGF